MTLKTNMQADYRSLLLETDEHAEDVVAINPALVETTIPALVNRNPFESRFETDGDATIKRYEIKISSATIADPDGYMFRIDGITFAIDETELVAAQSLWRLVLLSVTRETLRQEERVVLR